MYSSNHQGNANQNHNETSPNSIKNSCLQKEGNRGWKGREENPCTWSGMQITTVIVENSTGNVKWNFHMILQSCYWGYMLKGNTIC